MTINIPAAGLRPDADLPGPEAPQAQHPGRILVVDDVPDNRDILTRRLARRGFEVVEAEGGIAALKALEEHGFDLVLLDIMMPDLDGTEVVRTVRRTRSPSELPIIMVSAKNQSDDVAESLELGANDYITKPVDFTVALARIKTQIERKRAADRERASRSSIEEKASSLQRVMQENSDTLRRTHERLRREADGRARSEERLEYLAYHDPLTGLLNRAAFRAELDAALAAEGAPALLFVDLDRFKPINDVHGHLVGDELLQDVAGRLRAAAGEAAAVARLGGDEFAVLMRDEERSGDAFELGLRVVEELSRPFDVAGRQLQIGGSCGLATAADCGGEPEAMLKASDLAMYRAKAEGRGRVVRFEPHLLEQQRERSTIEVGLRNAVAAGQMEVYYQPLLRTQDRRLSCFEALVRWNHPERGLISPAAFIPIAEETGLINEIGLWVLREACREAAGWPLPIRVAVNLSPVQFGHEDLVENVAAALADSGLPPERLEIEITESGLLEAGEGNVAILERLRALGIRVSIDDFGTGYSSLSYLQSFVFDKLKIDRRFVDHIDDSPKSAAIMAAIVQLGLEMGIDTTAEGVETERQLAAVNQHGCSEVQGYLVSRPLPASDARQFIRAMTEAGGDGAGA